MKRWFISCCLLVWVVLATVPAMAGITITIDSSVSPAEVRYERTGGTPRVRVFALDIKTDNGTSIFTDVNNFNTYYWMHPGSTVVSGGEVIDEGSAIADSSLAGVLGGIDTNGVTIEMASLYAGEANAPADSGVLCTLEVDSDCTVSITENVACGGVVLEDASRASAVGALDMGGATAVSLDASSSECYTGPDVVEWRAVGSPASWCYPSQCYGDIDGLQAGTTKSGYSKVNEDDLTSLMTNWKIKEPTKGPGIPLAGYAADVDHAQAGTKKAGYTRVNENDLAILMANWKIKEPPDGPGIPTDCVTP